MIIILIFAFLILLPVPVFAYIDPGSGSAIVSMIVGFFVAIGVVLKTFWYKILSIFKLSKSPESQSTGNIKEKNK